MVLYLVKRTMSSLLALFVIITITFMLMHAIPGGPFTREKKLPEQVLKNIEKKYHLDDPSWKQYLAYLSDLLRGDLGPSFRYPGVCVNEIIYKSFPISLQLGLLALLITIAIGIPVGIFSALHRNHWQDYLATLFSSLGVSIPYFVLAALFIYLFGVKLGWLPTSRWVSWQSAIMPAATLAIYPTAYLIRLTRLNILEGLACDFIRTARAKGLPERVVVYKHLLKPVLLPIITVLGPMSAEILTGSFIIEKMFAIPGLGQHFVNSIGNRDYTMILGTTIFYATILITLHLITDLLYTFIDPRIKLIKKGAI